MSDITKKIENAKKQPATVENLNYIGDLYLKKGDKQTAIAYFYELAEKLHISQEDKKLAIYKKILNISTSESKAYEKIINIFCRMGLIAEEKKYIIMLANLYQNKGELNKLHALYRRIKEIDSENQLAEKYSIKDKQNDTRFIDDAVTEKKIDITPLADDIIEQESTENNYRDKEAPKVNPEREEELLQHLDINTFEEEERRKEVKTFVTSKFMEGLRNYSKFILVSFLLILLGYSIYLFKGKGEHQNITLKPKEIALQNIALKPKEIALQTSNFEITVMKMTEINELKGKVDEKDIKDNLFYFLSVRAKKSCIDDLFVSSPYSMISFIDKNGNQFKINDIRGLGDLTRIVYRSNICGKNAGAVFMKVIFACDKKIDNVGISLTGLERDRPTLIKWD